MPIKVITFDENIISTIKNTNDEIRIDFNATSEKEILHSLLNNPLKIKINGKEVKPIKLRETINNHFKKYNGAPIQMVGAIELPRMVTAEYVADDKFLASIKTDVINIVSITIYEENVFVDQKSGIRMEGVTLDVYLKGIIDALGEHFTGFKFPSMPEVDALIDYKTGSLAISKDGKHLN